MAYRFKLDDSLEKGARRIAYHQVELALSNLNAAENSPKNIHECRKSLKRTRALLKLLAPSMDSKAAGVLDRKIRDAARALSVNRDRTVVLDTLASMAQHADAQLTAALSKMTSVLTDGPVSGNNPVEGGLALDDVRADLEATRKRLGKLTLGSGGIAALKPGLTQSYKDGKRALKTAYKKRSAESFHDLRKAVQLHWRQMSLLARAWPEEMDLRVAAAREISQILGEEHDLELVDQASKVLDGADEAMRDVVRSACKERRKALRQRARFRAERLYAEDAQAFAARIIASWRAARKIEIETGASQSPADSPASVVPVVTSANVPRIPGKASRQVLARKAG